MLAGQRSRTEMMMESRHPSMHEVPDLRAVGWSVSVHPHRHEEIACDVR